MHMARTALITGITGQDGSYLADHLVDKGYDVHGLVRRSSTENRDRIEDHLRTGDVHTWDGDLADQGSINTVVQNVEPDEVYNLGAATHVGRSFKEPEHNINVTGQGALRVFEACRRHAPADVKVYQASSSEQFGDQLDPTEDEALSEEDPFQPTSPYACAKTMAHHLAHTYRVAHDLDVWCGILFNHESPRRGENFVTRKITRSLARIQLGLQDTLELGNLQAQRDWGHAREYVDAMWRMLQQDEPQDYVIATGQAHTVRDFLETTYEFTDIDAPLDEVVDIGEQHFRPADIPRLCGDPSKARRDLDWNPQYGMERLARRMFQLDLQDLQEGVEETAEEPTTL